MPLGPGKRVDLVFKSADKVSVDADLPVFADAFFTAVEELAATAHDHRDLFHGGTAKAAAEPAPDHGEKGGRPQKNEQPRNKQGEGEAGQHGSGTPSSGSFSDPSSASGALAPRASFTCWYPQWPAGRRG